MLSNRIERFLFEVNQNKTYQWIGLAIALLVAAGLRLFMLGSWGFWGDEYITVRKAIDVFGGGFTRRSPSMLTTHLILNVFGVTEWTARIVAAVVGIVTVPVLFWVVRRQFNAHVALLASFLLAVSPWHLYWSQNARFYTTLLLFFTLALFFFHWALEEDRPLFMIISLVFFGLAAFERLIAGLFVPIVLSYLVLLKLGRFELPRGLNWRNLAIYFVPGTLALGAFVLLTPTVRDLSRGQQAFGFVNTNPLWLASGVVFYMGIPLVLMAVFGAFNLLRQRDRTGLLLSLAATVPLASVMFISLFLYSANRYVFVSLTAVIVLAAVAVRDLLQQAPQASRLLAVGAALVLFAMPMADNVLYFQYQNGNRDNWKAALMQVAAQMEPGDQVVTSQKNLADFYLEMDTIAIQSIEQGDLSQVLSRSERTWFVLDNTSRYKGPTSWNWARANAHFMGDYDVTVSARTFNMDVYLHEAGGLPLVSQSQGSEEP